jgi:hypothetical protein
MVQAQFQKFSQPRNTSQGVLSSEYALRDNVNGKNSVENLKNLPSGDN